MSISETAVNMANKVMENFLPDLDESSQSEIYETRLYYEVLAQAFLDSEITYQQGVQQYVNYQEQAIQEFADTVYSHVQGRYFPNLTMSTNEVESTKQFYTFLARGFLEGIYNLPAKADDMADRVCAYLKQWYYPDVEIDDSKTLTYHTILAQGFLDGKGD